MNFTLMGFKNPSTGLTRDTYRAKLMGLFQLSPLSEEKLAGQISQVTDGGYSITEEDQRQREERAALSQRARDIVVNTVVGMEFDPNAQGFDGNKQRSFKTFLDYSGAPGAEEKNAQLHSLFTEGTPQEQKEYILRNLRESPYAHLTLEQANSMSDREVVDSFQKMLPLFFMLGEIDHMLSLGYLPFTPEEKEFLLDLKPTQDAIGLLQGRMNMIANPYYEIFHYERFTKVHAAEAEAMYSNAVKGYTEQDAYGHYVKNLTAIQFEKRQLIGERFAHSMEELGLDMETLTVRNAQGESVRKDNIDIAETLQLGGTILLQSPVGAVYAFQMDPQNDQPKHISPKEARKSLARGVKAGLGESLENLVDQVDDADHRVWWGSSQFKEMQSALTKLSELAETLNEQPTPQQLKDLRKRLRALEDTSKAYLERKREEKHLGAGEELVGKNDREQDRIDAANAIQTFAREKLSLLNLSDRLAKADLAESRKMKQESVWKGAANQNAAGEQMGKEEKMIRDAFGPPDYQPDGDVFGRCYNDFAGITDVPGPDGKRDNRYPVFSTFMTAQRAATKLVQLARKQSLTREDQELARGCIATITAMDLILQERGGELRATKAGPVEKKLIENPERFVKGIEKAPLFLKVTADLNPRKLTYFLENQGGRHIAGAMLEKAREIQQKTEENLKKAALQEKAALQAAQKSIKEDVPVTRPRSKTQPAGPKPKL